MHLQQAEISGADGLEMSEGVPGPVLGFAANEAVGESNRHAAQRHAGGEGDVAHAGKGADLLGDFAQVAPELVGVGEAVAQRQGGGDDVGRGEAGLDLFQLGKAAEQQPAAEEQHDREGDLEDDEGAAEVLVGAAAAGVEAALAERVAQVRPRALQRGIEAEGERGHEGQRQHEEQDAVVHLHPTVDWDVVLRHEPVEPRQAGVGDAGAEETAAGGEEQALGEKLAHEPAPARAERGAHGDLALAHGAAREGEVREVGAGDQHEQADRAHEQVQRLFHLGGRAVRHGRLDLDFPALVVRGMILRQPLADRLDLRAGLFHGRVRLELGPGEQPADVAGFHGLGDDEWAQHLRRAELGRALFGDPDDGVGFAIQHDRPADDVGVAGELGLPEIIADDDDMIATGLTVLRAEAAAEKRRALEDLGELHADAFAVGLHRQSCAREGHCAPAVGRHVFKDGALFREVLVVERRDQPLARAAFVDPDEAVAILEADLAEQDAVEVAVDGGAEADADRDRREGGERVRAGLAQAAGAELHVLPECVEPSPGSDVAAFLLDLGDAAEFERGGAAGLLRAHAGGNVVADLLLKVEAQFLVERVLARFPPEAGEECAGPEHGGGLSFRPRSCASPARRRRRGVPSWRFRSRAVSGRRR